MELFVHRLLDFRELRLVALAQLAQLAFQRSAEGFELRADLQPLLALLALQRGAGGLRLAAGAGDRLFQHKA
ncbi:MAG TPA: hypothetical protein VH855_28920, partial [Acetobacteraceae bacterium]